MGCGKMKVTIVVNGEKWFSGDVKEFMLLKPSGDDELQIAFDTPPKKTHKNTKPKGRRPQFSLSNRPSPWLKF